MTQVAKRYGYGLMAVSRFRDRMPQQLKAAIIGATLRPGVDDLEKLRTDEAAGLLGNLAHQRARPLLMQDVCMENGGVDQVARLSGVIHKNLEMVGRYLGLFANLNVSTNVNILVSEDYLRLRQALTLALRPFPEARRAVAEALHQIEGEVARKILEQSGKPPILPDHLARSQGTVIDQPSATAPVPRISRPSNVAAKDIQR